MILRVAGAFLRQGLLEASSYRAAFILRLLAVGLSITSFFFLSRFIGSGGTPLLARYGGDYFSFGLVGMILLNLQHAAVSSYPRSIREAQVAGTLEAMLASPTPAWLILLCAPLYQLLAAFLWAGVYLLAGGLLFGLRLDATHLPSLLLAVPLCLVAFVSIGFLAAGFTMLLRRPDPISFSIGGFSALLGGTFYPTTVLPAWLRSAGQILPITHALELVRRATFTGATLTDLAGSLAALAIFCALSLPAGLAFFGWTLRRARRDGSLTHF